jgi:hypothetical protein
LGEQGKHDGTGECLERDAKFDRHGSFSLCAGVLRRLCLVVGGSMTQKDGGRYCERRRYRTLRILLLVLFSC